jgi:hypothetical protein
MGDDGETHFCQAPTIVYVLCGPRWGLLAKSATKKKKKE